MAHELTRRELYDLVWARSMTKVAAGREAESSRGHIGRERADTEGRLRQIVDAIEQGIFTPFTKERLLELEARRDQLRAKLAAAKPVSKLPRLHPNVAEV